MLLIIVSCLQTWALLVTADTMTATLAFSFSAMVVDAVIWDSSCSASLAAAASSTFFTASSPCKQPACQSHASFPFPSVSVRCHTCSLIISSADLKTRVKLMLHQASASMCHSAWSTSSWPTKQLLQICLARPQLQRTFPLLPVVRLHAIAFQCRHMRQARTFMRLTSTLASFIFCRPAAMEEARPRVCFSLFSYIPL